MIAVNNIFKETLAQYLAILRAFYDAVEKNVNCTLRDFICGIKPLLMLTVNILSQVVRDVTVFSIHATTGSILVTSVLALLAQIGYLIKIYFPFPGGSVSSVFDAPFWFFNAANVFWGVFGDIIFGFLILILFSALAYIVIGKSCDLGRIAQDKRPTHDPMTYVLAMAMALLSFLFVAGVASHFIPHRASEELEIALADTYLTKFKSRGIESFSFTQKSNNKGVLIVKINGSTHTWEGSTSKFEHSFGSRDSYGNYHGPYTSTERFQGRYRFDLYVNKEDGGKDTFTAYSDSFLPEKSPFNPKGGSFSAVLERAKWMIKSAGSLERGLSNEERELMSKENG